MINFLVQQSQIKYEIITVTIIDPFSNKFAQTIRKFKETGGVTKVVRPTHYRNSGKRKYCFCKSKLDSLYEFVGFTWFIIINPFCSSYGAYRISTIQKNFSRTNGYKDTCAMYRCILIRKLHILFERKEAIMFTENVDNSLSIIYEYQRKW